VWRGVRDLHNHHYYHIACRVLGLVTCSGAAVLGFVSHTVKISLSSVAVCLCPFAENFVPIYVCNFKFSLNCVNFKFRWNIIDFVILPCVFCRQPRFKIYIIGQNPFIFFGTTGRESEKWDDPGRKVRPVRKSKRRAFNWPATKEILRCCILGQCFPTSLLTHHYHEHNIYADHKALKILIANFSYSLM
jgi:hypothetical protein